MKRLSPLVLIYCASLIPVLLLTFYFTSQRTYQQAADQAQYEANNVAQYINSELARFSNIPQLLASNYQIRQTLIQINQSQSTQHEPDKPEDTTSNHLSLNHRLLEISESAGVDDLYVMRRDGIVIAASNYLEPRSFIGGDFSFRPYFINAYRGENTRYYAMGIRSHERGVFFSAPIVINGKVEGVIALKIAASKFEQNTALLTANSKARLIAFGDDNVIFISSVPQWQLKQLFEPAQISWQQIQASKRYLSLEQQLLGQQSYSNALGQKLWQMKDEQGHLSLYTFGLASVPTLQMQLAVLQPYTLYSQTLLIALLAATLAYLLLPPLLFFLYRRVAGYHKLLYTRSSLEREITLRTEELKKTHNALIQSAKLATIGQLAASINHEINQPLSAISAYLLSSRRMLAKGKTTTLIDNLNTIESLVQRTHKTVAQLKQFSRAESGSLQQVSLQASLNNALIIVGPLLKTRSVELTQDQTEHYLIAEPLKFEQVLVNLISNAADAMGDSPIRQLTIQVSANPEQVQICIMDTGPGLNLQTIETLFEPFFSTKSDQGSGLGLTIARSLISSFGGSLTAENRPGGGAVFILTLKSAVRTVT